MPVTVGKIGELYRHFHGECGALLPPPYEICRPGGEPPSQLCTASQQNESVDVRFTPKADMNWYVAFFLAPS
jgi:hypothetical protein